MSDLVGHPKDRFSHDAAQMILQIVTYLKAVKANKNAAPDESIAVNRFTLQATLPTGVSLIDSHARTVNSGYPGG